MAGDRCAPRRLLRNPEADGERWRSLFRETVAELHRRHAGQVRAK